ncbi:MAG: PAS domain-containing protein [Alphaproteobacteria bacterium]|nr:PAS domain-containing protein [Alphaproteobacteria bacterium]
MERRFGEHDIIVSKTDPNGRLTYANDVFLEIAGCGEDEVLGQPHSILRHPDMPRSVFKLMWDRIGGGHEIFAIVKNLAKDGAFYWVLAHVTPSLDADGRIAAYHSNRRTVPREAIARIEPIYRALLAEESRHADRKQGMAAGTALLAETLSKAGLDYDEFVFSLWPASLDDSREGGKRVA